MSSYYCKHVNGVISLTDLICNLNQTKHAAKRIEREKSTLITGKISGLSEKKFNGLYDSYFDRLVAEVENSITKGFRTFIVGCNGMLDILAGDVVLKMKEAYPDISLVFIKIFDNYEYTYYNSLFQIDKIQKIIALSDISFSLFDKYKYGIEKEYISYLCTLCSSAITLFEHERDNFKKIKMHIKDCSSILLEG